MRRTISHVAAAVVTGYIASAGFGIGLTDVKNAVMHPDDVNYRAAGFSIVEAGLQFREDVTTVIEGPITSLIEGIKDGFRGNKDEFDIERQVPQGNHVILVNR